MWLEDSMVPIVHDAINRRNQHRTGTVPAARNLTASEWTRAWDVDFVLCSGILTMGLMFLQLLCVALVLRHGTDAQVVDWAAPTVANDNVASTALVTTDVAGSVVDDAAAVTIIEGVTGTVTTVEATVTANVVGYTTSSTEFDVGALDGDVTVAAAHTVVAATKSSYTLLIEAVETGAASGVVNTGTITITITVNANPIFASPTLCWYVADDLAATTTVATYSASAETGETLTYAIASGDASGDFTITAGNLVVATQLAKETTAIYFLQLTATDDVTVAAGVGEVYVVVRLQDAGTSTMVCCSGAGSIVGSLLAVIALLMTKFL